MTTTVQNATAETEPDLEQALHQFLANRTNLFRVAYRVTRDVSFAEDVVQEAWVRWQRADHAAIRNPAAFLTTATTRLAINVIQSAGHRHESPTDSPSIELADLHEDPAIRHEQRVVIEQTLTLLMARLTRSELTAYLLRKSFDYAYSDIAVLLHTSVPNARQLVRRAQPRLHDASRQQPVDAHEHRLLTAAFLVAARTGRLEELEEVLTREGLSRPCQATSLSSDEPAEAVASAA